MKLDGMSMDLEKVNMEKLRSVFPECFSEQKLDIDKLLSLCGEYIDNDFEKYKFEWKGKSECLRLAQKRSTGTLRPCKEKSVNFDDTQNVYIEGDNLEVLKLLQTAYFNKIKMIYIDPPYNTGNDFVYEDDFADPMARYKEVTQQTTKSNPETMGRYHTNWLNMMYPRLRLAANLLTDDGVIFISIDDNELFNLKKICDEVFGEENFLAAFPRVTKKAGKSTESIAKNNDYILLFAKKLPIKFNLQSHTDEGFKFEDEWVNERGKYKLNQTLDYDSLQYSPSLDYPIEIEGETLYPGNSYEKYIERQNGRYSRADWAWRWSKELFKFGYENGFIVLKKYDSYSRIYTKTYQNVSIEKDGDGFKIVEIKRTKPLSSLEFTENQYSNDNAKKQLQGLFEKSPFDYSKPTSLIEFLISFATRENDIVLDFFSGSATTAHAVMQLNAEDGGNRKFICVQLPELCDEKSEAYKAGYKTICEIGEERIRRAGQKILKEFSDNAECKIHNAELKNNYELCIMNSELNLDIGFKVFKLDSSNLKLWDSTPITGNNQLEMFTERMNSMIDSIKDDRSDMDVIYEIMLKMGVPLTESVTQIQLAMHNAKCIIHNEKPVNNNSELCITNSELQKVVYAVGDFLLLIALYNDITAEDIDAMAAYAPAKIVCAEQGFKDNTALSNAHYILRDKQIELKLV